MIACEIAPLFSEEKKLYMVRVSRKLLYTSARNSIFPTPYTISPATSPTRPTLAPRKTAAAELAAALALPVNALAPPADAIKAPADVANPAAVVFVVSDVVEASLVTADDDLARLAVAAADPVPVCTRPSGPVYFPLKKSPFPPTSSWYNPIRTSSVFHLPITGKRYIPVPKFKHSKLPSVNL
jgi:hypothetical protein